MLIFPWYDPQASLSDTVTDIGNLDLVLRDNAINNAVAISGGKEGSISLKGIEHGRQHLGKLA